MSNKAKDQYKPAVKPSNQPSLTALQAAMQEDELRMMSHTQAQMNAQMNAQMQQAMAQGLGISHISSTAQVDMQTIQPRPKTQYGIPRSELTGASRTVYYIESNGYYNMSVGEAYFPVGILDKARHVSRELRYPCPAFDTKEEAEDHVRAIKRSLLVDSIERLLSDTTTLIFERGVAENPETTLLEALQNYLREVKP